MELEAQNTNQLAPKVYRALRQRGVLDQSRNGPVLRLPEPLTIRLTHPWQRVNFSPVRDANPFFHYIEACAMLVDENNAPFLSFFAKRMATFSDNGQTFNAFYGSRLRTYFGMDQLNLVIRNLTSNPHSRQEVALMWDPHDLMRKTKDKACNLLLMFSVDMSNRLQMTSVNRSNDAIWGMVTGANIVHLSFFQEYVACALNRPVGDWFHFTNNLHVYTENPQWAQLGREEHWPDYYARPMTVVPLFNDSGARLSFDRELHKAISQMVVSVESGEQLARPDFTFRFVRDAVSMFNAYVLYKRKAPLSAVFNELDCLYAHDWCKAAGDWILRRYNKEESK